MKASELGAIVADIEDIRQSVNMIVLTVKGSVPFLDDFGCGLYDYIDSPVQIAGPLAIREIRSAVTKWETRATITDISYSIVEGNLRIELEMLPVFSRSTDAQSSIFIGFELDATSGTLYLVNEYGYRILVNGKQLTITI